jgi:molecular chaperone DnaK (HSP70)
MLSGVQVVGTAFNRNLGGRNFDDLLVKKLVEVRVASLSCSSSASVSNSLCLQEFKVKFKIDCTTEEKAMFRLRTAAAKTRESVSGMQRASLDP